MNNTDSINTVPLIKKFQSYLIDLFIINLSIIFIKFQFSLLLKKLMWSIPRFQVREISRAYLSHEMMMNLIIFTLIFAAYHFISLYSFEGRTIGQYFFKLRTIPNRFCWKHKPFLNLSCCLQKVLGLYLLTTAWFSPLVFPLCLISLLRKDKRNISDFLAGSKTVFEEDYLKLKKEKLILQLPYIQESNVIISA